MNCQMYDQISVELRRFLQEELPNHSCLWWDELVMPFLTPRNQRIGERLGPDLFQILDLAELLRIAEKNWVAIAHRHNIPSRVFGLVKNLQLSRNAYAHRPCTDETSLWHTLDQISIDLFIGYLRRGNQNEAA